MPVCRILLLSWKWKKICSDRDLCETCEQFWFHDFMWANISPGRRVIKSGFAANPNQLLSSTSSRPLSKVCVFDRLRDLQSVGFLSTYTITDNSCFVWMCTIDLEYSQNFRMFRLVYGDAIKTLANHSKHDEPQNTAHNLLRHMTYICHRSYASMSRLS